MTLSELKALKQRLEAEIKDEIEIRVNQLRNEGLTVQDVLIDTQPILVVGEENSRMSITRVQFLVIL